MQKVSGEIIIKKYADYNIVCFDVDIEGFFPVRVCLWPQDHPTCPPTLQISPVVSSVNSGFDYQ